MAVSQLSVTQLFDPNIVAITGGVRVMSPPKRILITATNPAKKKKKKKRVGNKSRPLPPKCLGLSPERKSLVTQLSKQTH